MHNTCTRSSETDHRITWELCVLTLCLLWSQGGSLAGCVFLICVELYLENNIVENLIWKLCVCVFLWLCPLYPAVLAVRDLGRDRVNKDTMWVSKILWFPVIGEWPEPCSSQLGLSQGLSQCISWDENNCDSAEVWCLGTLRDNLVYTSIFKSLMYPTGKYFGKSDPLF